MRDRLVVGIRHDDTRHRLLSTPALTLEDAVRICRAKEAAKATQQDMPQAQVGRAQALRKTRYQRIKQSQSNSNASSTRSRSHRVANRPFESRKETTSLEPSVLSVDMTPTRSPDVPPERRPAILVVRRDISREDAQRMHPSLVTCGCKSQTSAATMIASRYQRAWTTMTQGQQQSSDGFPIQAVTSMQ